jgi:CheY-like chemotaxis protein
MPAPRVLVVDDDEAVRMTMQEGLQRDGFESGDCRKRERCAPAYCDGKV